MFQITGKHIEVTDAMKEHAREKTSKLPRFYDGVNQVDVIIEGRKGSKDVSVEIIARGEHNIVFVGSEAGQDAYACIDIAVHKLESQLRKKKGKERNNKHIG